MKIISKLYTIVALLVASILIANPAYAQAERVKVAIIDTGVVVENSYPDAVVTRYDARPGREIAVDTRSGRQWGSKHGTWVAGALLNEVQDDVEILSYRVESKCRGNECDIRLREIYNAALHAVAQDAKILIISSAGAMPASVQDMFADIAAQGVHLVFSAGNNGGTSPYIRLASLNRDYIHVVGALDKDGDKARFSDDDDGQDLFRWYPGEDIHTVDPSGASRVVDGTSYSTSLLAADLVRDLRKPTYDLASIRY
ncbi:S8/S53 family peptidase [Erythrobacter aureus]|uniref:Peptidase S8/S53 domain-containing protein n=1 Tax=Erythrobacter aureus TaxID=2182384 RepID=A0A345YIT7_9SPHN|nr:S8/S53 family peptidase [Erythrobacter aureus]AXK43839.1 hypothetical protein DVR09_15400 [Erythrobacter aureus]